MIDKKPKKLSPLHATYPTLSLSLDRRRRRFIASSGRPPPTEAVIGCQAAYSVNLLPSAVGLKIRMLFNPQPQSGWEVPTKPTQQPTQQLLPNSFINGSSAKTVTSAAVCLSGPSGDRPKQMGLFIPSFSGHRDPLCSGPGARLIPWFLPEHRGNPDQKQSKNTSLRASSPSLKNSTTIYLSCLIEGITGELGYVYSILFSSFSTLPLYYQAPFPNPPTSIKHIINHIFSYSNIHSKYHTISLRSSMRYTNQLQPMHQLRHLRHLPSSSNNICLAQRSKRRSPFSKLTSSKNNTFFAQRSICRSLFSKNSSSKIKTVNNYKSFSTACNRSRSSTAVFLTIPYTFMLAINLTKHRLPACVKSINQGFKNVFALFKRTKRRRLASKRTKRIKRIRRIKGIKRRLLIRIRKQRGQESESDRLRTERRRLISIRICTHTQRDHRLAPKRI